MTALKLPERLLTEMARYQLDLLRVAGKTGEIAERLRTTPRGFRRGRSSGWGPEWRSP